MRVILFATLAGLWLAQPVAAQEKQATGTVYIRVNPRLSEGNGADAKEFNKNQEALLGRPVLVSLISKGKVVRQTEWQIARVTNVIETYWEEIPLGEYNVRFEGDGVETVVKGGLGGFEPLCRGAHHQWRRELASHAHPEPRLRRPPVCPRRRGIHVFLAGLGYWPPNSLSHRRCRQELGGSEHHDRHGGGYGKSTELAFADLQHGCFLVNSGKVATTQDGGKTWQDQRAIETAGSDGPRLCFVDKDRGWCILPHNLHATVDGGKTWTPQQLEPARAGLLDLHFADARLGHVLISGTGAEVRRTTDGGQSWKSLGELQGAPALHSLSFPSSRHGWVVGNKGYIAHYQSK